MKSVFCILSRNPHKGNLKTAEDIVKTGLLDVVIIVDAPYTHSEDIHKDIKIVYISDEEAISNGYQYSCKFVSFNHKDTVAWDKAFYYFGCVNKNYDFLWFMEDDVFIPSAELICNMTSKYNQYDVVASKIVSYPCNWNLWKYVEPYMKPPLLASRVCGVGLSRKLITCAADYVYNNKRIPFIEGFIPTIAANNNLVIVEAPELSSIHNCLHKPTCSMPLHCGSFDNFNINQFKHFLENNPTVLIHAVKKEEDYCILYDHYQQMYI